ncbi:MAG: hypothetical protein H8E12_15370 [Rhodobacteraceae bacterium]|nr:hypothetical protein [Paracoccaceae bacterium]
MESILIGLTDEATLRDQFHQVRKVRGAPIYMLLDEHGGILGLRIEDPDYIEHMDDPSHPDDQSYTLNEMLYEAGLFLDTK